jgi:hypothetical protein
VVFFAAAFLAFFLRRVGPQPVLPVIGGQPLRFFVLLFAIEKFSLNFYRVMSAARLLNDPNSMRETYPKIRMMTITEIVRVHDGNPFTRQ